MGGRDMSRAGSRIQAAFKAEAGPLGQVARKTAATRTVPQPPTRLATTTVIVGFLAMVASLFVFGSIADGVRSHEVFLLDTWATPFLHALASPGMNALMNGLTDIGSSLVIIPLFVVAVAALMWRRRHGAAAFLAIASGGALALETTMKVIFERPRPKLEYARVLPDYSFPSGHTMNATVFYIAIALIAWSVFGRRLGLVALGIAIVVALGVGVSRIYLGYHYLTDVAGGTFAGVAWLLVVGAAFNARRWWTWAP
jgi:undecaprenyl-diphosphatase